MIENRPNVIKKTAKLDISFVSLLHQLGHKGEKMQAYTIDQHYSIKEAPVFYFPIGHSPDTETAYTVLAYREERFARKRSVSHYSNLIGQSLVMRAVRERWSWFEEYIQDDSREQFKELLRRDEHPCLMNEVIGVKLVRPAEELEFELASQGKLEPYSQKWCLRFYPLSEPKPDADVWKAYIFSGRGRACLTTPGQTITSFEFPEEALVIHTRNASATGAHWMDYYTVLAPTGKRVLCRQYSTSCAGNVHEPCGKEVVLP